MGKFKDRLNTAGIMAGNTAAAPIRAVGEVGNAIANIPRQIMSWRKNYQEVKIQTRDALVDNFLSFGKVEGKWYEKLVKVPTNLFSACTRRPVIIVWAGIASWLNQWVRQPFKKLFYTPGKMFKWMRGSLKKIFSKEKWFEFEKYDTHETKKDTWISKIQEKASGFWGVKWSSPETKKPEEKSAEKTVKKAVDTTTDTTADTTTDTTTKSGTTSVVQPTPPNNQADKKTTKSSDKEQKEDENIMYDDWGEGEILDEEEKKKAREVKENEEKKDKETKEKEKKEKEAKEKEKKDKEVKAKEDEEKKAKEDKSISAIEKKRKEEIAKKAKEEQDEKFPEWNTLGEKEKKKYRKKYKVLLKNNPTEEGIITRGKEEELWETPEEIIQNLKKEDSTFAGYFEEIMNKPKHKIAA